MKNPIYEWMVWGHPYSRRPPYEHPQIITVLQATLGDFVPGYVCAATNCPGQRHIQVCSGDSIILYINHSGVSWKLGYPKARFPHWKGSILEEFWVPIFRTSHGCGIFGSHQAGTVPAAVPAAPVVTFSTPQSDFEKRPDLAT